MKQTHLIPLLGTEITKVALDFLDFLNNKDVETKVLKQEIEARNRGDDGLDRQAEGEEQGP